VLFPYRDNLVTGAWPLGIALLIAFLTLLNIPLFLAPEWHAEAIAAGGFIPLQFSLKPLLSSYRLITASVLHADFFHLAGNCLFLAVFGRTLERLFGLRLLLLLFPALGIAGFLAEWAMHADSPVPVIGASGAIAALMGAYLPLFPGARIRMFLFLGLFWKRFTVPAWLFLPYWIGLQLLSIAMGSQDGVAYAVHAGSFAAGAIGAIIWKTSYMGADEKLATFKRESFQGSKVVHH
jgi:membrane associated rhomboid family serine protease